MTETITGLIAAPFTAFDKRNEVDYAVVPRQVDALLEQGVSGAYVLGTTGEGVSCSLEERLNLMEAWSRAAHGRLKLIAHIGALALPEVKILARQAVKWQFDATSVVPPTYFRPGGALELARYLAEVAAYAPELPFYYYHTMMARLDIPATALLETVEAQCPIPNLAGVKFNHHDLFDYQCARRVAGGKYDIVYGVDEFFAGALTLGARGFIGSTYNYAAKLYRQIWDDWESDRHEAVLSGMRIVCDGVRLLHQYGGLPCGKALMRLRNLNLGGVRPPLTALSEARQQELLDRARLVFGESI